MSDAAPSDQTHVVKLLPCLSPLYLELRGAGLHERFIEDLRADILTTLTALGKSPRTMSDRELVSCLGLDYAVAHRMRLSERMNELTRQVGADAAEQFLTRELAQFSARLDSASAGAELRLPAAVAGMTERQRLAPLLHELAIQLHRFFTILIKLDKEVTRQESEGFERFWSAYRALTTLEGGADAPCGGDAGERTHEALPEAEPEPDPIEQLQKLIGLDTIKREIDTWTNHLKVQQMRREKGLKSLTTTLHMVFTGSPGTGKTTVARIVARILHNIGCLSKGHLTEVDRAGLVGQYVGQTASKVDTVVREAMGGALFVDEAYSLVRGSGNDYGTEALDALVKRMEDHREDFVVIVAGYTEEMEEFLDANPGLRSRFTRFFHFPDYTSAELLKIFDLFLDKYEYVLEDDARALLEAHFTECYDGRDRSFGNGRMARRLFEYCVEQQSNRLAAGETVTLDDLKLVTVADVEQGIAKAVG